MALWLIRAGGHGEYEKKFLDDNRVYLTWHKIREDLTYLEHRDKVQSLLEALYPDASKHRISNHVGQIWSFSKKIKPGDWVVLPSKKEPAVHVAEVTGNYTFDSTQSAPFFHYRDVKWIVQDVPRSNFDQDLLYSFGAAMTVCRVHRHDAERRVRRMAKNAWKSSPLPVSPEGLDEESEEIDEAVKDLTQAAQDQLAKLVIAKFKGHNMERLVDAVLRAQGYTTFLSPEGPDKGIDILAAPGPMGFEEPRVCVQVKSGDSALDHATLNQLIGVMQNVQASHGLLVSWGGFKSSVNREEAMQFFRVRLWNQRNLIEQVLSHYDKLDEEIRAALPLKRIWVVAETEE